MSFAFMPLYVGDYLRDTRHLSALRHGIYLLLLMHCWAQRGPLPLDEQECCGIANCRSADEVDALRYVLSRFFVKMEDGWYNTRMQLEVERAESISRARSTAGRQGYQAKAKQLLSKCLASASTPTTTTTTTATTTATKAKSFGAESGVSELPNGPARKLAATKVRLDGPSEEHRAIAASRGVDCEFEFVRYRDWQAATGKTHKDEVAGFRNWLRGAKVSRVDVVARQMDTMDKITGRANRGQVAEAVGGKAVRALRGDVRQQDEDDVGQR